MELINNKYKVIRKINQNSRISSYAVQDIIDNKEVVYEKIYEKVEMHREALFNLKKSS